jgi:hypothetical protein
MEQVRCGSSGRVFSCLSSDYAIDCIARSNVISRDLQDFPLPYRPSMFCLPDRRQFLLGHVTHNPFHQKKEEHETRIHCHRLPAADVMRRRIEDRIEE